MTEEPCHSERSEESQAIIIVSKLWFAYDGTGQWVLRDLSLNIPAGAITAILGPNGSGKTTLLHLILGLLSPARGTIHLAGRPRTAYSRREMGRLVALVPQGETSSFNFSVLEYVLFGRAPYLHPLETPGPADRQIAAETLHSTGIGFLRDRSVTALSGGERQLVTLARALAQQPRILLLDEPTAHLDLGNQAALLDRLRSLSAAGTTIVLTTHDPNLAATVADYAVLMRQGQVLVAAPMELALTSERLSETYGVPIQVLQLDGQRIIRPSI